VELFAIGIYGSLVTLVVGKVDKQIIVKKKGQSVALQFFNCISQDLIQDDFFFPFLASYQPPGKITP